MEFTLDLTGVSKILVTRDASSPSPGTPLKAVFKIVDPDGVTIYENAGYAAPSFASPDITYPSPPGEFQLTMPLDANGNVTPGSYRVYYKIQYNPGPGVYSGSTGFYYAAQDPTVTFTVTQTCSSSTLKVVDATSYGDYFTSISRSLTLNYPDNVLAPVISATDTVTANPIYTGTFSWEMDNDVVFTIPAQSSQQTFLTLVQTITGSDTFAITCLEQLCEARCILQSLEQKWASARGVNSTLAAQYATLFSQVASLVELMQQNMQCGHESDNTDVLSFIKTISGVDGCDCGCGDSGDPVLIQGECPCEQTMNVTNWTDLTQYYNGNGVAGAAADFNAIFGSVIMVDWQYRYERDVYERPDGVFCREVRLRGVIGLKWNDYTWQYNIGTLPANLRPEYAVSFPVTIVDMAGTARFATVGVVPAGAITVTMPPDAVLPIFGLPVMLAFDQPTYESLYVS